MTNDQEAEYLVLLEDEAREAAKTDLLSFLVYIKDDYEVAWYHRRLCEKLQDFIFGDLNRLMVFMPPRHGKSEIVSRALPAFLLGIDPDLSIIGASYSGDLAGRMNRDCQRIIDTDRYRSVFPGTTISAPGVTGVGKWARKSSLFEIINKKGGYHSTGPGGTVTGTGGDFILIDDLIKNQVEASSPSQRQKIHEFYISALYTRLQAKDKVLITLTRWHEDDIAGRLKKAAKEDPDADQWVEFVLPAIKEGEPTLEDPREEGEALWPTRFPIERLIKNKSQGASFWNALFQQRPSSPEGNIVRRDQLRYYQEPPKRFAEQIISMDAAFKVTKKSSFVVIQVWGRVGPDFFLLYQWRKRAGFTESLQAMVHTIEKYPAARARLVEDKANGPAIIERLKTEFTGIIPIQVPSGEGKVARLHAVTPAFEGRNVYIPDPKVYSWAGDYVEELVTFPAATDDDQVDCTSQSLDYFLSRNKNRGTPKMRLAPLRKENKWRH